MSSEAAGLGWKMVYYTPPVLAAGGTIFAITRAAMQFRGNPLMVLAGAIAGAVTGIFAIILSFGTLGCPCCGAYVIYWGESVLGAVAFGIVSPLLITADPFLSGFNVTATLCASAFMYMMYNYRGEGRKSDDPQLLKATILGIPETPAPPKAEKT